MQALTITNVTVTSASFEQSYSVNLLVGRATRPIEIRASRELRDNRSLQYLLLCNRCKTGKRGS